MKSTKNFLAKLLLVIGIMFILNMAVTTPSYAAYENDITPPVGKLSVLNSTEEDGTHYVEGLTIQIGIYATDDMCKPEEIMYHLSTEPIDDATRIDDGWIAYEEGATEEFVMDAAGTYKIYGVFKDARGNISKVFSGGNTEYTVAYNANFEGATASNLPKGMNTKGNFGASFGIASEMPTRKGYYFWGWSTDSGASAPSYYPNEILPAYLFTGANTTIPLYAIWTTDIEKLPELSNVVKIGDYVDYPVMYENVEVNGVKSSYNGWRVLSVEEDGTVNLVSAGVPLAYYHGIDGMHSEELLTKGFTDIPVSNDANEKYSFIKSGMGNNLSIDEAFYGKYTYKVRAMNAEDILKATKETEMASGTSMNLANEKYKNLLVNDVNYYLASTDDANTSDLWNVSSEGSVSGLSNSVIGVRPVVSLRANIKSLGMNNLGRWEIKEKVEEVIGDYIDYGIDYTDVYTDYEFSGDWAWRMLSKKDNPDGTSDIEIISTGIPAKLYYYYGDIDNATWCASPEQRAEYSGDYYISSSVDNANVKAAAGLMYNFDKIEFSEGPEEPEVNKGKYISISGNQDTKTGLFKSEELKDKEISVRSVMHADLKPGSEHTDVTSFDDLAIGLFKLNGLTINPHSDAYCWLASPFSSATNNLRRLQSSGYVGDIGNFTYGVRPVVKISNVRLKNDNGVWRIQEEPEIQNKVYVTLYDDGTLGFSNNQETIANKTVVKKYGDIAESHFEISGDVPWIAERESITTVEFVNEVVPYNSTARWFHNCSNLTEINNIGNLNTSNVTYMNSMFANSGMTEIDISGFDTSNVTNMNAMFAGCTNLISVDLSSINANNVTKMYNMFMNNSALESVNLENIETENVQDIDGMFAYCTYLETIDLSDLDMGATTSAANMFLGCSTLSNIIFGKCDTREITNMQGMFANCTSLTTLDLSNFDTSNVTNMTHMFLYDSNLTHIYVGLDWVIAPTANNMLLGCGTDHCCLIPTSVYVTLYTDGTLGFSHDESTIVNKTVAKKYGDISEAQYASAEARPWNADVASITAVDFVNKVSPKYSTAWWFTNCTNLITINNIENLYTCNVTNMNAMFGSANKLKDLNLSNFDVSNVTSMINMFMNCSLLSNIILDNWDVKNVTDMTGMFAMCTSIATLDLDGWNTENLTCTSHMFLSCTALSSLSLKDFDTSNVTDMEAMFARCISLRSLDLSSFNTQSATNMKTMFLEDSNLTTIYVSSTWNTNSADTTDMFTGCLAQSVTLKN